ncbi:MAG: flavin-containing monooxygenase [Burkholderiales bacterium]
MEDNKESDFDILIVGAGLSGIGTACQLQQAFPHKSIGIVERRNSIGGTWDLFRYPGIRSDSDMFSFGFNFRPWNELKTLADGPSIKNYIEQTAREYGVLDKIHYGLKSTHANWDSKKKSWTVTAVHEATGEARKLTARFLALCTGYYNYDAGFLPTFPGEELYKGQKIHPQFWPEKLDYTGKKVVVIGSGATAVTLVPAMAEKAGHVTMLQRSPSYIFSLPGYDKITEALMKILPEKWAFGMARRRNILIQRWLYLACRRWPQFMRSFLLKHVQKRIGQHVDMRHFTPKYMPWDERLCAVPDCDLFNALRAGKASVETDHIDTFTKTGIRLQSGKELDADIIVTATGLNVQMLGGMELSLDHRVRPFNQAMIYKGVMVEDLPNLAWVFGYTNASWTLKSDLAAMYMIRLLKHMEKHGLNVAIPGDVTQCKRDIAMLDSLQSGYVRRALDALPRQGNKYPWQVDMHYGKDKKMLLEQPIVDGILFFN